MIVLLFKLINELLAKNHIIPSYYVCDILYELINKNPEITEQDAQFTPESTPTDEPLRGANETFPRYERWSDTVKSVNPVMTMTPPAPIGSTGY